MEPSYPLTGPLFTVAVVHGGPGAAGEMAPVARRLGETRRVLEPIQTATTLEGQIAELRDALPNPLALIGFSWGAWLSLLVASRYPELVTKLILVSCPALDESYVAALRATRLSRWNEQERAEFDALAAALENPATPAKDALLARLGELASKADSYAPIDEPDEVRLSGDAYQQVWTAAAEMRRNGELLRSARKITCPVVAIHGDYDPSPAAGVSGPLAAAVPGFRFVTLEKCGHKPWMERYAREDFYRVLAAEIG